MAAVQASQHPDLQSKMPLPSAKLRLDRLQRRWRVNLDDVGYDGYFTNNIFALKEFIE
jgi:hypothetical protein